MRKKLGSLRVDENGVWLTVGSLVYDFRYHTTLVGVDLRALLPWCDRHATEEVIRTVCVPYPDIENPPLLQGYVQWEKTGKNRKEMGYIYARDDAHGRVTYIVAFRPKDVLRWFGSPLVFWHVHDPHREEKTTEGE
jgi:hypothetical protein